MQTKIASNYSELTANIQKTCWGYINVVKWPSMYSASWKHEILFSDPKNEAKVLNKQYQ